MRRRRTVRQEITLSEEEAAELQRRAQAERRSVPGFLRGKALEGWTLEKETSDDPR